LTRPTHFPHLQDLAALVGQLLGSSDWIAIGQDRIAAFAEATEDRQWIHLDTERAASSPYRQTIAHGFLTLSLLSHLAEQAFTVGDSGMGVNYGLNRVRFPAAVPAGARVRGHFKLLGYEAISGGAQLVLEATVECEGESKPVCVAEWLVRRMV
jgi:acyl dehydratase